MVMIFNHDAIVLEYNSAKKEADLGSDTAMLEVFSIFYKTYPVLADKTQEASNYLMKSALAGNASAQFNMGFLQQNGDVFEKTLIMQSYGWRKRKVMGIKEVQGN